MSRYCALSYLCEGKGVILHEKTKCYSDFEARPEPGKFFKKIEFYSLLKHEITSVAGYENVKIFYELMRMRNLSDLNEIYNMQDTMLLCEIFENLAIAIIKKCPYNPRKCTSANLLSGYFHRFLWKAIISLPTCTEYVKIFEKAPIGGISCVNT